MPSPSMCAVLPTRVVTARRREQLCGGGRRARMRRADYRRRRADVAVSGSQRESTTHGRRGVIHRARGDVAPRPHRQAAHNGRRCDVGHAARHHGDDGCCSLDAAAARLGAACHREFVAMCGVRKCEAANRATMSRHEHPIWISIVANNLEERIWDFWVQNKIFHLALGKDISRQK